MRPHSSAPLVPVPVLPGAGSDTWKPIIEQDVAPGRLRAAIYDRASEPGGYVYAEQAHYNTAVDAARFHDMAIVMYRHEDKKGGKLNRQGLHDIRHAAQLRLIDVVIVDTMARLGRRGPDRLKVLEEFDRLGVKVLEASKQRFDEPGIVRYVTAWQDEQYLRDQADKAIRMMPHAIAAGKHPGPDPVGYCREYDLPAKPGEKPTSRLVKHPQYGPLVSKVFEDYDAGKSIQDIVHGLNSGALPNPKSRDGQWTCKTIWALLQRKVYLGIVEWGRTHPGEWAKYDGYAAKEGAHEPVVDPARFARVQIRLQKQKRKGPRRVNQRGHRTNLLDGLLVCCKCGSGVYTTQGSYRGGLLRQYGCARRHRLGRGACDEPSVSVRLADQAVIDQVMRLKAIPWEAQAFDEAVQRDPYDAERRRLRARISADERELQNEARAFTVAADFSPEVTAAFRKVADEIKLRLRHHQDQLAALPERHVDTARAKEVHELMMRTDIPTFLADARERGDMEVVRDILVQTVGSARIVARGSRSGMGRQATWARARVEWTPEIQLLLDAGRLVLADDVQTPEPTTRRAMAAERARRYRARKREVRGGA